MFTKRVAVILIILFSAGSLAAKEYDLTAIIESAARNNRDIQLVLAELKSARAEKKAALSTALPKIFLDMGYNRNFFETDSLIPTYNNELQMNAVLQQAIVKFQAVYAIQGANYLKSLTEYRYESTRAKVLVEVKKAFYQALLLQEVYEVALESEESARDNYENVKDRYESGIVSEFDLLQAEVNWKNFIPETIKAGKDYELALNNLKVLAGVPLDETFELDGSLEAYPPIPGERRIEDVLLSRPDYNALLWEKRLKELNVKANRANYYPTLDASLSYSFGAASDDFRFDQDSDNIVLGLSLNIPLYSGGSSTAKVEKASSEAEKAAIRIAQLTDNIRIELQNVRLRMREASQRIEAAHRSVVTARRAFEIAESRVSNRLATQVELKEIRVAFNQAQLNYYSAIYDYLSAYFDWERAVGHTVPVVSD